MYTVKLKIKGVTPLQQSREYSSRIEKLDRETSYDYENRTWTERAHIDADGRVFHPSGAFKQSLVAASRYSGLQIKGQGKKTYTAKIMSGLGVLENLTTNKTKADMKRRDVFASAMGGKSKNEPRVWKAFPTFENWTAETTLVIYDDILTLEIVRRFVEEAGRFIGIGVWRPERGGEYGRFEIASFEVG